MTKTKATVPTNVTIFFINVLGEYSNALKNNTNPEIAKRTGQLNSFIDKLTKGSYEKEKEQGVVLNVIKFAKYFTEVLPASSRARLMRGTIGFESGLIDALLEAHRGSEFPEEAKKFIDFMFNSLVFPWGTEDYLSKEKNFKLVSYEEWIAAASKLKNKELTSSTAKIKVVYEPDYTGYLRPTYEQTTKEYELGCYVKEQNEQDDPFNIIGKWCGMTLKGTYHVYVPVI